MERSINVRKKRSCTMTIGYAYPDSREGVRPFVLSLAEGVVLMSTYEEFMIILTAGLLIVAILDMKNK